MNDINSTRLPYEFDHPPAPVNDMVRYTVVYVKPPELLDDMFTYDLVRLC